MAVAFDAVGPGATGSAVTGLSWTHTPVGTPTGVAIGGGCDTGVSAITVSSATYGGTTTTKAQNNTAANASRFADRALYGLPNPAAGAQTVAIGFSQQATAGLGNSVTVTGGDTTTLFSNSSNGNGTGAPSLAVTSAVNELAIDVMFADDSNGDTFTVGADQTQRTMLTSGNRRFGMSTEAGAASVTMSWTVTFTANVWGSCAGSFKEAGGAAAQMFMIFPPRTDGIGRGGIFPGNRL